MNVVLVHGIWDRGTVFKHLRKHLEAAGHACHAPDLEPAGGDHGLVDLAEKLKAWIDGRLPADTGIALVGFSMGAIVSRIYLQRLGGLSRTRRFFTISAPHRGTLTAMVWTGKAARDMRFGSDLLRDLAVDADLLRPLRPQSYYTPLDLMVLPTKTSRVHWAENHCVPALLHPLMLRHPKILRHIAAELAEVSAG